MEPSRKKWRCCAKFLAAARRCRAWKKWPSASLASVPLGHGWRDLNPYPVQFEGRETPADQAPIVNRSTVTPEYFHLLGMTLLRGRFFTDMDNDDRANSRRHQRSPRAHVLAKRRRARPAHQEARGYCLDHGDRRDRRRAQRNRWRDAAVPELYLSAYQRRTKDLAIFVRGRLDTAAIPVAGARASAGRRSGASRFRRAARSTKRYRRLSRRGDSRWKWSACSR